MFTEIVEMFSEIGKAWDAMTEGLSEVKDDYLAWWVDKYPASLYCPAEEKGIADLFVRSNPNLFTPELLDMALESWGKVIRGVELYVNILHGTPPAQASHPHALMAKRVAGFSMVNSVTERHDVKARALVANLVLVDTSRNLCRDIFSAPPVNGVFPRPSDIQNVANDYAQVANTLR
jgi:hypothetical protein